MQSSNFTPPESIVAEIEAEQALLAVNRELITRFKQKIQTTLAHVWGEYLPTTTENTFITYYEKPSVISCTVESERHRETDRRMSTYKPGHLRQEPNSKQVCIFDR